MSLSFKPGRRKKERIPAPSRSSWWKKRSLLHGGSNRPSLPGRALAGEGRRAARGNGGVVERAQEASGAGKAVAGARGQAESRSALETAPSKTLPFKTVHWKTAPLRAGLDWKSSLLHPLEGVSGR